MWKTILKRLPYKGGKFRSNPRLQEKARREANKIMRQRHGQKFIDATEGSSISPRNSIYGEEYMALLRLIGDRGMSPAMAAKQPFVPKKKKTYSPPLSSEPAGELGFSPFFGVRSPDVSGKGIDLKEEFKDLR